MSASGDISKLTIDLKASIALPSGDDQGYVLVHKRSLQHIRSLSKRLPSKPDNYASANFFIFGCGVSGIATYLSLMNAEGLSIYLLPSVAIATVALFILGFVMWRLRTSLLKKDGSAFQELEDALMDLESGTS